MTRGALLFAFDSDRLKYTEMAAWLAHRIHRHLDIPVSIITDSDIQNTVFDQVIKADGLAVNGQRWFADIESSVPWRNLGRVDAYRLSPYDHTLVLDVDYVVASDMLLKLFDLDQDFIAHQSAYEVTGIPAFDENNYFGKHKMSMSWATVMCFRRSTHAEMIFDMMKMIRDNWFHYRHLYSLNRSQYRNDIALSIALNTLHGHVNQGPAIPWSLASLDPNNKITAIGADSFRIEYRNQENKPRWIEIADIDIHVMGKGHLGDIIANTC
jgi:hypothetical protein